MAHASGPLPNIPIKHASVRKVLSLTAPLESRLRAYIAYYTAQQGFDPKQAPSESEVIVAILENFLDRDRGFHRHVRERGEAKKDGVDK